MARKRYTAEEIIGNPDKIQIEDSLREGRAMIGAIWIVVFGVLGFALSSCAPTRLPLHTTMDALKIRKTPLTAALVMPDALKNATSKQEVSCAGTFDVPIGAELETGMTQALSQVFESVEVVDDKSQATGDDVLIEIAIPQLQAEGHCALRRTLYATGPLYMFFDPSDTYEGHAELSGTVSGSEGQPLLTATFKSKVHTKNTITADNLNRAFAVETVFRESLIDTIEQLTRGLVKSSQFREYADRRKGKSGER